MTMTKIAQPAVVTAVLMIAISLLSQPPEARSMKFTWYGATPEEKATYFARRARALWRFFPIFETPQPFSLASERNL